MFTHPDERLSAVPTPEEFTRLVVLLVWRYDLTYFEAIQLLCDYYDREYESVRALLTPRLRDELQRELTGKHLLKPDTNATPKLV